ncbi:hypothetical protein PVAP13_1KG346700 [Panicum virgatum]|uniref:F-box domain-containing protein n=1 Tax=Panicum virgatum TaxID=38727 RepID=A0A8T0XMU1_PANVG|nr:hypothetical protein PVAP13_1KG346700 [Panicum virgatum]
MEASPLPLDLLLEIFARSGPATVARCGATCKFLRRHVADRGFLRRLRAASSDRFLLGLLYHRRYHSWKGEEKSTHARPLFAAPKSSGGGSTAPPSAVIVRLSAELAGPYDPVASRGGLLLLKLGRYFDTSLCVCDPVGGRSFVLPPRRISDDLHVVMPGDAEDGGGGVPFEVLIADSGLRTQTYSSRSGAWGPVTRTAERVPRHYDYELVQPSPVVLGGVAHWLYHQGGAHLFSVLALDVGTGQAAWIEVPRDCHRRRRVTVVELRRELLLASSSAGGELALLVWERPLAVCMWTVSPPSAAAGAGRSWARRVVIGWAAILGSVRPASSPLACQWIEFLWFAEGSGTVVFNMHPAGTVLLNLRTLEVRHLPSREIPRQPRRTVTLDRPRHRHRVLLLRRRNDPCRSVAVDTASLKLAPPALTIVASPGSSPSSPTSYSSETSPLSALATRRGRRAQDVLEAAILPRPASVDAAAARHPPRVHAAQVPCTTFIPLNNWLIGSFIEAGVQEDKGELKLHEGAPEHAYLLSSVHDDIKKSKGHLLSQSLLMLFLEADVSKSSFAQGQDFYSWQHQPGIP